jgi:phosphoribosylanthranilate isomerase
MNRRPLIKICGLTRREDLQQARELGADYLGSIGVPNTPRYQPLPEAVRLFAGANPGQRVRVLLEPTPAEGRAALEAGFAKIQAHWDPSGSYEPHALSTAIGPGHLWLAPRLPDPLAFRREWIPLAERFLIDGYRPDRIGGTGMPVDTHAFRSLQEKFPEARFALAGGIRPENVAPILHESHAPFLDLSSGVESAPGHKDPDRLAALFQALSLPDPPSAPTPNASD